MGLNVLYGTTQARRSDDRLSEGREAVLQVEVPVLYRLLHRGRVALDAGAALGVARAELYERDPAGLAPGGWTWQARRTKFSASLVAEVRVALHAGVGLRAGLAHQWLHLDMTYISVLDPLDPGDYEHVTPASKRLSAREAV